MAEQDTKQKWAPTSAGSFVLYGVQGPPGRADAYRRGYLVSPCDVKLFHALFDELAKPVQVQSGNLVPSVAEADYGTWDVDAEGTYNLRLGKRGVVYSCKIVNHAEPRPEKHAEWSPLPAA
jgi:hypothetical protein